MVKIRELCEGIAYAVIKRSNAKPWCVLTATAPTLPTLQDPERLGDIMRLLQNALGDLTAYEVCELQTHEGYPKCREGVCVLDWLILKGSGTATYVGRKTVPCPKLVRNLFHAHIGAQRAHRQKLQILAGSRTRKSS